MGARTDDESLFCLQLRCPITEDCWMNFCFRKRRWDLSQETSNPSTQEPGTFGDEDLQLMTSCAPGHDDLV